MYHYSSTLILLLYNMQPTNNFSKVNYIYNRKIYVIYITVCNIIDRIFSEIKIVLSYYLDFYNDVFL